jgi:GAF domain-containing protein
VPAVTAASAVIGAPTVTGASAVTAASAVTGASADESLRLVPRLAHAALPSAIAASVTLLLDGHPRTSGASAVPAAALDGTQYESGGPCVEAARDGQARNVVIAEHARRWPEYAAHAANLGIESSLSVPLSVDLQPRGALTIYSAFPAPLGADEERLAELLARQASATLACASALEAAERMTAQLREALETRDLIGQAKGILMERESCAPEEAFDMLRRASQRTNRKLRDVANDLVSSRVRRTRRHP